MNSVCHLEKRLLLYGFRMTWPMFSQSLFICQKYRQMSLVFFKNRFQFLLWCYFWSKSCIKWDFKATENIVLKILFERRLCGDPTTEGQNDLQCFYRSSQLHESHLIFPLRVFHWEKCNFLCWRKGWKRTVIIYARQDLENSDMVDIASSSPKSVSSSGYTSSTFPSLTCNYMWVFDFHLTHRMWMVFPSKAHKISPEGSSRLFGLLPAGCRKW